MSRLRAMTAAASACLVLAAVASLQATAKSTVSDRDFNPTSFSSAVNVNNKWLPMQPGTQLVYTGTTIEGKEKIPHRLVFTVTDLTKVIAGVRSVVMWDRDFSDGELVESELAFFAQDRAGNVWQLGEYPEEYEDGKFTLAPAWIHGIKGARAGLTMKGNPVLGAADYSLGWGPAVGFNDRAKVIKRGLRTCVPVRCYEDVLVVDEFNPDEPGRSQLKYYAPGVGNVRVGYTGNDASKETLVLTKIIRLSSQELAHVRAEALKLEASAYKRSKKVYGLTQPAE